MKIEYVRVEITKRVLRYTVDARTVPEADVKATVGPIKEILEKEGVELLSDRTIDQYAINAVEAPYERRVCWWSDPHPDRVTPKRTTDG